MGRYDPPNKKALLMANPRIENICQLCVESALAEKPEMVEGESNASRASLREELKLSPAHARARAMTPPIQRRGRRPAVTEEKVQLVCDRLREGDTEQAALLRAGIGHSAWAIAKQRDEALVARVVLARDQWAQTRHAQHMAARYESQLMRSARRKALRPQPTKQVRLVKWHLISRVPLNFVEIPQSEIVAACEQYSLALETWQRQEKAFGLMRIVYAKRALLRGAQTPAQNIALWPGGISEPEPDNSFLESVGCSVGL